MRWLAGGGRFHEISLHARGRPAHRRVPARGSGCDAGALERFFEPAEGSERFYYFAFLVPGGGFEAAHAWLAERAQILPRAGMDETVFAFSFWDALACYCDDPTGDIVELIAHRDVPGEFADGRDLLAISKIGLVTPDPHATARALHADLGLELWSGDRDGLAFIA